MKPISLVVSLCLAVLAPGLAHAQAKKSYTIGLVAKSQSNAVFQAAYERVNRECCGPETSCYECLRNYRNQMYHPELKRGLADSFLGEALRSIPGDM